MMISSEQVINILKSKLNKDNYVSFLVAGSLPQELKPQSDLDLFFVIKNSKRNEFFEDISNIAKEICKKNPEIEYSFFRGPLKLKNKGLIHIIVYTDKLDKDALNPKECFLNETRKVLESLSKFAKVIAGKAPKTLLKGVDLSDKHEWARNIKSKKQRLKLFLKEGYIQYYEWQKTSNGWFFILQKLFPDSALREYYINYYKKSILGKK